jgi:adenylate cyclase
MPRYWLCRAILSSRGCPQITSDLRSSGHISGHGFALPGRAVDTPASVVAVGKRVPSDGFTGLLNRFYKMATNTLVRHDAVIDKLIGDEVMALYLPDLKRDFSRSEVPLVMLEHGRGLLRAVGYGSGEPPFVEMGIGLDFGEAFVGNIGQRALYDFTAVGDVVNTASRLQAQAAGGEIVLSERVANGLSAPVGTRVQLELKGKSEPQTAYRVSL